MRLPHLLIVVTLFSLCAGVALAQSQPSRAAAVVASQSPLPASSANSLEADISWLKLYPQLEFLSQDKDNLWNDPSARVDTDQDTNPFDGTLSQPPAHKLPLVPEVHCARIRAYRVALDGPGSDATHLVSYTTCVPAERVSLYTAVDRGR